MNSTAWIATIFLWMASALSYASPVPIVETVFISMTEHGSTVDTGKNFNKEFFKDEGVVFFTTGGVSTVQGRLALISWDADDVYGNDDVDGYFTEITNSISVDVAPYAQGTWNYILTAFDKDGEILGSDSITNTQDVLDPDNDGWGYITLALNTSAPIANFSVRSDFLRNSGIPRQGESDNMFGLSDLTFERTRFNQVPLPGSLAFLSLGLLCLGVTNQRVQHRQNGHI